MFTCTNYYNQVLTVQLCDAHEFEWRRHDPANNHTTYKYPGMDEFVVKGFIDGDTFVNKTDPTQLEQGRQWVVLEAEWEGGNFKGLRKGDIVTMSHVAMARNDIGVTTFVASVEYDHRMTYVGENPPASTILFNDRDVDAGRIGFYK